MKIVPGMPDETINQSAATDSRSLLTVGSSRCLAAL